jgi:hypothetical protein
MENHFLPVPCRILDQWNDDVFFDEERALLDVIHLKAHNALPSNLKLGVRWNWMKPHDTSPKTLERISKIVGKAQNIPLMDVKGLLDKSKYKTFINDCDLIKKIVPDVIQDQAIIICSVYPGISEIAKILEMNGYSLEIRRKTCQEPEPKNG